VFERPGSKSDEKPAAAPASDFGFEVVAFLAEQRLEATPANYALGYRFRAARDSGLGRAVDAVLMSGQRLTQDLADQILAAHIVPEPDSSADRQMRVQTRQLAELAAGALATTGQFGRDLSGGLDELRSGVDTVAIVTAMLAHSRHTETALAAASQQIDTLRQEVEAAKGDAARDALTGLHNRRGVEKEIRALSTKGHSALAICDIDFFKSINDRYGHVVGDRVLQLVATSLTKSCDPHLVARWGGEEFIILMNGVAVDDAVAIIDRARAELAGRTVRLRSTDQPMGAITFSAGVAALSGRKFDEAVSEADTLLYEAKASGRNRVVRSAAGEQ
jgi:diguanylate cyclase